MKKAFEKLAQEINFAIPSYLENSLIEDVNFKLNDLTMEEELELKIAFYSIPFAKDLILFVDKIKKYFNNCLIKFNFNILNSNFSKTTNFELIKSILYLSKNQELIKYLNFEDFNYDFNEDILLISLTNTFLKEKILNIIDIVKEYRYYFNFWKTKIIIDDKRPIVDLSFNNSNYDNLPNISEIKNNSSLNKEKKNNSFSRQNKNKNLDYFKVSLKEFYSENVSLVEVEGKIINIEKTVSKNGYLIYQLLIYADFEAVFCRYFIKKENENNSILNNVKVNNTYIFKGNRQYDENTKNYILILKEIVEVETKNEQEEENEERVEFSTHTSMSAMDGFLDPFELFLEAKNKGFNTLGISDLNNVQSFPEIAQAAKENKIKPLYGSIFSIISSSNNIISNLKNGQIKDETYIVFDLETSGLSPRLNEIIEFGAVKFNLNSKSETFQFFIKNKKPLPSQTTKLTNITQQMLDESPYDEKEALLKILDIFKDYTLVAHNANFDISFINEKLEQNNLPKLKNQIIDTLALAKVLISSIRNYRLESVSKKYSIDYNPSIAHRADYDANVLKRVFVSMIENLTKIKIFDFASLNEYKPKIIYEKQWDYELSFFAKNQKGLKKLFQLISKSLTTNYFNGPKLFEEEILKSINDPDLLIAPLSFDTKINDLLITGTKEALLNEIKKYNVIGIPSPHLFSLKIFEGKITKNDLQFLIKDFINSIKELGKIPLAYSDCRYINEDDKYAHLVYIYTKGLEGRRHKLFSTSAKIEDFPTQKLLTTKEMKNYFSFLNDEKLINEIVIENPKKIANSFSDEIEIIKKDLYTPKFPQADEEITIEVYNKAKSIYGENLPQIVEERIKKELDPIIKYHFSVIYWITHKLVKFSYNDGYIVGSRGSVGSSLVATLLGITEVNPLPPHYYCLNCKYNIFVQNPPTNSGFDLPNRNCPKCNIKMVPNGQTIPFETFLGFNADKVPDIDLNFSGEYQPIIHNKARDFFGHKHTFRAGTISTVASKTAYGFVKKWCEETNKDFSNAFISYIASRIEGSKRTTGQHPGGIIIIPKEYDVEDFTPINFPANDPNSNWMTTHFDFNSIHDNLLKLDLLGHDDPTIIKFLQETTGVELNQIPFNDPKVLSLFNSLDSLNISPQQINGEKTGVLGIPEFGTKFVRKMLLIAKPTSFNDLINISGLSHGTDVWNGNAEELVKKGLKLSQVVSCRDDIMVYLIQKGVEPLKSFNIMEKVRKGKGISAEEEELLNKHNIEPWYIESLKKIKYMFPKAHAIAYVMMAWRIAWFKIYYPLAFYASYFSIRVNIFDINIALGTKEDLENKIKEIEAKQRNNEASNRENDLLPIFEIINEMFARGFKIKNINLYRSLETKWIIEEETKSLIPPFTVIDGLGENVAKSIILERNKKKFTSKEDLRNRTILSNTLIEKLDSLGVLQDLNETDQITLF